MIAEKRGVFVGNYGNCFLVIEMNLGGFRFSLHCDQSSVSPHIEVKEQKAKLNQLADLIVALLNKGDGDCNGGDCERHRLGAEPCAGCQYCDAEGNV